MASLSTALAGRYRIERELGAGGMATVYLAHDEKHDRKVAIKVLKPELAAVLGAERFVVEIKTTASLQHPHILPLFDSGTADGFLFYVMPYIPGETIREKLNRETQFGVDDAVRIAREVADALDYAHRHGVIHRDIKPENILLHDGRAMVMDFGIALAVSAAAGGRMTETGLSLGTPHYMSPEQATAEKEISPKADVYSLGAVLFEMLTGNPPHTGATAQQVIMKIITEPAESVAKYRKTVPPHVVAAVARAVEKLPADRFESAKAFADALANPAYTHATMAGTVVSGAQRSAYRSAPFLTAVSVAVVAVIVAASALLKPAPPREVARFSLYLPDSQALTPNPIANRVALSPDGRTIVYAGASAGASGGQLWVRRLDQLRATPLPGTETGMNPAFSPDGRNVAFTSFAGRRAIKRIALAGGPPITLTDSLVDAGGVTWAEDGYVYYDGHLEGDGVARVKETGGRPEIATRPDNAAGETYHVQPSALPGGRGVLFTIARGAGNFSAWDIGVLDARTGKHKVLTHGFRAAYAPSGHLVYVTDGGTLMAAPFDLASLTLTGDGVALNAGVSVVGNARADAYVSATGSLVYAAGSAISQKREFTWVARDGSATPVDPSWSGEFLSRATLSPSGRAVALAVGSAGARQIWVKQLDRGPASRVADVGGAPAWSPDGKWLVFGRPGGLSRVPADGSALPAPLVDPPGQTNVVPSNPVWTTDGKWIVFQMGGSLLGVRTDGDTSIHKLVDDNGAKSNPAISPDGKWLAYQSDESGQLEVYVRPFPDTKVTKRQVSVASGMAPRWSRDGQELFYVDPIASELVSVPIISAVAFTTGLSKRLFSIVQFVPLRASTFDVSPDGKRFLFSRQVGGSTPKPDELILVQNFVEELKEKVKKK